MSIHCKLIVAVLLVIYQKCGDCFFGDENCKFIANGLKQFLNEISIKSCAFFTVFNPNGIASHRIADKIHFLEQEIQIPDGVSDKFVSEIQKILNYYENPLLKLGHELLGCNGSSSQYERCWKNYNQFEVNKDRYNFCEKNYFSGILRKIFYHVD